MTHTDRQLSIFKLVIRPLGRKRVAAQLGMTYDELTKKLNGFKDLTEDEAKKIWGVVKSLRSEPVPAGSRPPLRFGVDSLSVAGARPVLSTKEAA